MMRDDVIKKRMKAQMPAPTPLFAGRVRQTLDKLPERKRVSLFRYVPAAAMTVVAVAVIGLAVMSRMDPDGMGNWFQALAGGEETATVAPTPEPQATEETGLETVIPTETPMGTVEVTDTPMPTPAPEATEEPSMPTPAPEQTALLTPAPTASSGYWPNYIVRNSAGKSIFGNNASLISIQVTGSATTYVLKVEVSEKLTEYYNSLKPDQNGMITIKPYWEESDKPPMLIFLICSGVSKQEDVDRDRMSLAISAFDDNTKYGIYVHDITASMQVSDDGESYLLYIRNGNNNFQPTSDFTIVTCSTYFETGTGLEYYGVACN